MRLLEDSPPGKVFGKETYLESRNSLASLLNEHQTHNVRRITTEVSTTPTKYSRAKSAAVIPKIKRKCLGEPRTVQFSQNKKEDTITSKNNLKPKKVKLLDLNFINSQ
jgi:hypothetical protein